MPSDFRSWKLANFSDAERSEAARYHFFMSQSA
jgi:hypothetical protein